MASIDRRPDGRYRARWREYPAAPQKTRQFTRKRDAEHFLDSVRRRHARHPHSIPTGWSPMPWRSGIEGGGSSAGHCNSRMTHRGPGAAASRRSLVSSSQRSASASATYMAS